MSNLKKQEVSSCLNRFEVQQAEAIYDVDNGADVPLEDVKHLQSAKGKSCLMYEYMHICVCKYIYIYSIFLMPTVDYIYIW